jgi:hypothetical protein
MKAFMHRQTSSFYSTRLNEKKDGGGGSSPLVSPLLVNFFSQGY